MDQHATITRACEYGGHFYVEGEQIDDHDVADRLVRLGFAARSAETTTRRSKSGTSKEES